MLKTFTIAPEQDSIRVAFNQGQRSTFFRLSLVRAAPGFPEYLLKQDDVPVAILRGKEMVCGGDHFAVIPLLPLNWDAQGDYRRSPDNVPYWDGEQRLSSLGDLLYDLSCGLPLPQALDGAVDAEDDEFFADLPEVAYTGQHGQHGQPEDFPLQATPGEWEPEPETPEPTGMTPDECLASKHPHLARIYPWSFWYRGKNGNAQQVILEATYEDAQRVWDKLSTTLDMTSRRP